MRRHGYGALAWHHAKVADGAQHGHDVSHRLVGGVAAQCGFEVERVSGLYVSDFGFKASFRVCFHVILKAYRDESAKLAFAMTTGSCSRRL